MPCAHRGSDEPVDSCRQTYGDGNQPNKAKRYPDEQWQLLCPIRLFLFIHAHRLRNQANLLIRKGPSEFAGIGMIAIEPLPVLAWSEHNRHSLGVDGADVSLGSHVRNDMNGEGSPGRQTPATQMESHPRARTTPWLSASSLDQARPSIRRIA